MTIVGSNKLVVYDDISRNDQIVAYDRGVTKKPNSEQSLGSYETFGECQLKLRAADVLIPQVGFVEPLREECAHFLDCIEGGHRPLTDKRVALQIVPAVEEAEAAMDGCGER